MVHVLFQLSVFCKYNCNLSVIVMAIIIVMCDLMCVKIVFDFSFIFVFAFIQRSNSHTNALVNPFLILWYILMILDFYYMRQTKTLTFQFVSVTIWTLAIWTVYSMRYLAIVDEHYSYFVAISMATIGTFILAASRDISRSFFSFMSFTI